jgi:hypothetical protein
MRLHDNPARRSRPLVFGVIPAAALAATLAACSAAGHAGPNAGHHAAAPPATAPATSHPPSAAAVSASGLSGTWNGQYGGSYQGTFVIHWRRSGSKLGGSIDISNPAGSLSIHGSVAGGSIQFGTVGSYAITYSGTVSGDSMSGTYKVGAAQGGNWSASKS